MRRTFLTLPPDRGECPVRKGQAHPGVQRRHTFRGHAALSDPFKQTAWGDLRPPRGLGVVVAYPFRRPHGKEGVEARSPRDQFAQRENGPAREAQRCVYVLEQVEDL